jgi:hypothetical protein
MKDCSLSLSKGVHWWDNFVNVDEDTYRFILYLSVYLLVYTSNRFDVQYRQILPKYKYCLWKKRAEIFLFVFYLVIGVTVTNSKFLLKSSHAHNNVIKVLFSNLKISHGDSAMLIKCCKTYLRHLFHVLCNVQDGREVLNQA